MRRLADFVAKTSSKLLKKQGKLLLDFGSGTVKFYLDGKLLVTKSSSIASHRPGNLEEIHLVERGTVVDYETGKSFLNREINLLVESGKLWPRFDGYYLLPSGSTQVDQIIIKKILYSLDRGSWQLVKKSTVARSQAGLVIDIGFDLTEIMLGFGTNHLESRTLKSGSRAFTTVIREVVRDRYQLDISWQVADRIKKDLVGKEYLLTTEKNAQKLTIRGKDIYSFTPKTLTVNAFDFQGPLLAVANDFFDDLKLYFSQVSTDVLMNGIEEGVELWGEGAKLAGLEHFLAQKLQTKVKLGEPRYEV